MQRKKYSMIFRCCTRGKKKINAGITNSASARAVSHCKQQSRRHGTHAGGLRQRAWSRPELACQVQNTLFRITKMMELRIAAAGKVMTQAIAIGFIRPQLV